VLGEEEEKQWEKRKYVGHDLVWLNWGIWEREITDET